MTVILKFFREQVWSALPAGVSPRDRRIAGLAWPGFLWLLAGLIVWKRLHHHQPLGGAPVALAALAPLLALLLLASHSVGSRVYRAVMLFFITFGFFVSHVILIAAFYLIVTPLAWGLRLTGKDLIDTRHAHAPHWTMHPAPPERRRFYRLF